MNFTVRGLIGLLLILTVAYLSLQIIDASTKRQAIVIENAEVKNIKYGLLSVYSWKRQISEIMSKKVKEFELTTENRRELRSSIQNAMYQLLNEVDRLLAEKRSQGGVIRWALTSLVQSLVFDVKDLKSKVPEFTEIILDELDNYETREKLRIFIQKKIDELLYETVGEEDLSKIEFITDKNDCADIVECKSFLHLSLVQADRDLNQKSLLIVGIAILIFLLILLGNTTLTTLEYALLIALCGILLYAGINTPMIDIDARIENFRFLLMGEPLEFNDQVLFFQSKSIFEVVQILIATGEYQSIAVGGLIFLFSIVFPMLKLLSSLGLLHNERLYNNKFIKFLALKSGKWSMADVVVVAIFMSYIGFRGVIENQLKQLEDISGKVEILTTDNSNFGVGFILFLSFCIGGLVLATVIDNQMLKRTDS